MSDRPPGDLSAVPAITILMPTYKGMPLVKTAIESLLAQKEQNWELLISDDCSPDGTRAYLAEINDPRVTVFLQEKNLGIFGNLNFLIKHARAEITAILCQDDYLLPGGLGTVLSTWAAVPPEVGLIRFGWNDARESNRLLPDTVSPDESDFYFLMFGNILGNLTCASFRTNLIEQAGMFREDLPYGGDFEMWTRVARLTNTHISRKAAAYVRVHEGSASNSLNRRGELVHQICIIVESLRVRVAKSFRSGLLDPYLNVTYIVQHRVMGLKRFVKNRDRAYLREFSNCHEEFLASPAMQWFFVGATLGGKWRGLRHMMLKALLNSWKAAHPANEQA